MPAFVIILLIAGVYFIDSAVRNRNPVATALQIIKDPKNARKIFDASAGTWQKPDAGSDSFPATTGGSSGSASGKYKNGELPSSALQVLSWNRGQSLVPAAADALEKLNAAYKAAFGRNLVVTDSYRSLVRQYAVKASKGFLAANPGQSNHGWGIAVDLGGGINSFGTKQYLWMQQNAAQFGWVHPSWAEPGGQKPEPWHWEFTGAVQSGQGVSGGGAGKGGGW